MSQEVNNSTWASALQRSRVVTEWWINGLGDYDTTDHR